MNRRYDYADSVQQRMLDQGDVATANDQWAPLTKDELQANASQEDDRRASLSVRINECMAKMEARIGATR